MYIQRTLFGRSRVVQLLRSTAICSLFVSLSVACSDGSSGRDEESGNQNTLSRGSLDSGNDESESDTSDPDDGVGLDDDGGDAEIQKMEIEPGEVVIELDLGATDRVEFQVTGIDGNGDRHNVTDEVEWRISNKDVGEMDGNAFVVAARDETEILRTVVSAYIGDRKASAQITLAAYQATGPNRDFFFILPIDDEDGEKTNELSFSTDVQSLDVFFNMDTTVSMGEEIANLQAAITDTIIPEVQEQVMDTQFGVGAFEDFPELPYGEICSHTDPTFPDQPFQLFQKITDSDEDVEAAVGKLSNGEGLPIGCGGDVPESWIESLYQIAVGGDVFGPGSIYIDYPEDHSGIGGAGFRDGSLPVVVAITDAMSHAPGEETCDDDDADLDVDYSGGDKSLEYAHTRQEALDELEDICGRVVTIASTDFLESECGPVADGIQLATATGARVPPGIWDEDGIERPMGCDDGQCCTGKDGAGIDPDDDGLCPLVFRVDQAGSGVDSSIVDGLRMLALYAPFDVTTVVVGNDTDSDGNPIADGHTTADFITSVVPKSAGEPPLAAAPTPQIEGDRFTDVTPGTEVTFDIKAFNDFQELKTEPQLFTATIKVLAGTCSELDERTVFILVPPKPINIVD